MSEYISERLRALVARRADHSCAYCLLAEEDAFHAFHLDHIISRKHGGDTKADNLAYSMAGVSMPRRAGFRMLLIGILLL